MSTNRKPVKRSTVDEVTRRIVANSNGKINVDQAKSIATDSAERVNRNREGK